MILLRVNCFTALAGGRFIHAASSGSEQGSHSTMNLPRTFRKPATASRSASTHSVVQLISGWCALLVWVAVYSPVGLGVAAAVGCLDRDHHLRIHAGEQGLQLVLHHGPNCTAHRHGIVARALTVFAQPASATDPDHVIQFSAADNSSGPTQLTVSRPANSELSGVVVAETFLCCARETRPSLIPTHPPPDERGQLLCLRSTLLLI